MKIPKLLLSHSEINVNSKHILKDRDDDNMDIKSALIIAIESDNLDIVKILLKNPNINVNTRSKKKIPYSDQYEEKTALCVAIEKGNIEIIKELLSSKDIDINSRQFINISYPYREMDDPTRKTTCSALKIAIDKKNVDIANLLISHPGISINDQDSEYIEYMSKMSSWIEYKMGGSWSYIMPLIYEVMNYPGSSFELQFKAKSKK